MRGGVSLLAALALSGCVASVDHRPVARPTARWWQELNDSELSLLIERGVPQTASQAQAGEAQVELAADIARQYVALRARQTALVLLADREDLDEQRVTTAQPCCRGAALAHLTATRFAQKRARADIVALRDGLARLTGAPPGTLDRMPGGAIPLPSPPPVVRDAVPRNAEKALAHYDAARLAAADAQSLAEHVRALAAAQAIGAPVAPQAANDANRDALEALQAEEQARAAMMQAYVALAEAIELEHRAVHLDQQK